MLCILFIPILAHGHAGASEVSFWPVYACVFVHIHVHAHLFIGIGIQNECRGGEEIIKS